MKKILKGCLTVLLLTFITLTSLGYLEYRKAVREKPLEEKISEIQSQPHYVAIENISDYLKTATVATEDQRFYKHHGVDVVAYGRILYVLVTTGQINSGGSTISQQLAKNLYFGFEPSLIRKFAEFFVVHDLESQYEKDEILELYVNIINYGDQHMGIYEATHGYFDKDPKDLSLDEATLVAGIPQSPANYQLSNHSAEARKRQKVVLQALIDTGSFTQEEIEQLLNE